MSDVRLENVSKSFKDMGGLGDLSFDDYVITSFNAGSTAMFPYGLMVPRESGCLLR